MICPFDQNDLGKGTEDSLLFIQFHIHFKLNKKEIFLE